MPLIGSDCRLPLAQAVWHPMPDRLITV